MHNEHHTQKLASAKRKRNERSGIHNWHPYYAGYSEAFVFSAIDYLKLNGDSIVLDPWGGSGTTQFVCAKQGIRAIGVDVNPVMTTFTNAKTGLVIKEKNLLERFLTKLESELEHILLNPKITESVDPLHDWMDTSLIRVMRSIMSFIEIKQKWNRYNISTLLPIIVRSNQSNMFLDPLKSFLQAGLFVTSRQIAGYTGGSNPTWTRPTDSRIE